MTALQVDPKGRQVAKPPRSALPRLNRGDHEFLPAALEILETPLSPIRSTIILTICGFVVVALAWSYIGRVDIIASAQGKIQPVGRTKTIQPIETGKVLRLVVGNGQRVKAGDVLVELDSGEARADESTLSSELRSLKAEVVRRKLALDAAAKRLTEPAQPIVWPADTPPEIAQRETRVLKGDLTQLADTVASLMAQQQQKLAEHERLQATITAQERLVATLKERVDMRSELFGRNAESKAAVIDAKEVYETQQTTLAAQKGQVGEADASVRVAQRDIDKTYATFVAENAQKLADAERQIGEDEAKLAKARIKTSHMILTSPLDGVVQGSTITTVGQVVTSGEQVMQIVPDEARLEIECYLPNGDSGFVKPGEAAVVKIESFPFTDYGTVDARVTRIAKDAIPEVDADQREQNPVQPAKQAMFGGAQRMQNLVFPVTLALDQTSIKVNGADVALSPGMAVTVEIKTGTRRILSYLFSPLIQVASTAMRER